MATKGELDMVKMLLGVFLPSIVVAASFGLWVGSAWMALWAWVGLFMLLDIWMHWKTGEKKLEPLKDSSLSRYV